MNQTRSFLLIAWLAAAAYLFMQWNQAPAPTAGAEPTLASADSRDALPTAASASAPLPGAPATPALPGLPAAGPVADSGQRPIVLANDALRLTVDLQGGELIDSQLLQYRVEKKPGSPNVRLLSSAPADFQVAEAGLIAVDGSQPQRDLEPAFQVAAGAGTEFSLAPGASELVVPLLWNDPATGLAMRRTLTLARGSYVLTVRDEISNTGAAARRLYPYVELARVAPPPPPKYSFMTNPETFSFVGAAWYTPQDTYEKSPLGDFLDEKPTAGEAEGVWIAMLRHHFATAWVPPPTEKQVRVDTRVESHQGVPLYAIRSIGAPLDIAPGARVTHLSRLWVGPKLQKPMATLAETLPLSVDYGVLAFIGKPLFWLLSWLHALFGNWGWAIIAIVVLLKAVLFPLSAKQYQSMAKMRSVQPRVEALKERYGDDKQQFQMAMMELYKKEKINPIGGCLPMLIPIPIFLGLYWVLLETVELRHAPWIGWIQNLTAADPYFILPAINLVVMYLTQKLTPTPGMDPMQKKMMQFMPLIFGVMMAFFPAGLVLYWVTNGILGLAQQWWMTKKHGTGIAALAK